MAGEKTAKPYKWFSPKSLKLRLKLHRSNSCSTSSHPTPPLSPLKPKDTLKEDELREVFSHFDRDGDGKTSALEIRAYFGSIGEYMSSEEAQVVIENLDPHGDDSLDFDDFVRMMSKESQDDDLRRAFEMFEIEKGSGYITPKGLQRMLDCLGSPRSHDECVAMIQFFDIDGNGVLDFNEFHQMMASTQK